MSARRVAGVLAIMATMLLAGCASQALSRTGPAPQPAPTVPSAKTATNAGDSVRELSSGGQRRRYLLHVPASLPPGRPSPLVVNLHGLGESPELQARLSGMSPKADAAGFIVAYPEGQGDPVNWDVGPGPRGRADLEFIRDLIRQVSSDFTVDPARVFVTGISNGGGMADHVGCELSDTVAAIAPVSGAYLLSGTCRPSKPMPVVAFHGTADRIVPYDGKGRELPPVREWAAAWATRNGCSASPHQVFNKGEVAGESWDGCKDGATVTLYTINGGGHTWPGAGAATGWEAATKDINATDVIWDFFAAHPRK